MSANLDKALTYHLTHDSGLIALISTRVYPLKLPQGTTIPALTYQEISTTETQAHLEASFLPNQRYQFTAYGVTVESVSDISKALKNVLDGYKGQMGTGAYVTQVEACLFKDERLLDDPDTGLFWKQQDYQILWIE